jgi:excisionase family DNA binding protein
LSATPGTHNPEPTPLDPDTLLDAKQTAALLAISARTLWSMTNAGMIPSVRIGRSVRYRRAALLEWVIDRERGRA